MADDLTGPNVYVHLGEIELPPFAHAFVLDAPSMAAIRRRCYLVEREHYDALLRDAERYRWLRDRHEYNIAASEIVQEVSGEGWDAAIDAAMGNP